MSNDDPFTLDLFNTTTPSSGLGLGVTAFGSDFGTGESDDEEASPPAAHLRPVAGAAAQLQPRFSPNKAAPRGVNFHLDTDRGLAKGWKQRAQDNLDAIRLAAEIEVADRPATAEEQARLIRFTGFGASELTNAVFRRPGEDGFRSGWDEIGAALEAAVSDGDYASLARCTQYAHFTPEFIVRAMWAGLQRLGWRGGRVLEPGIGTGLFPALMPAELRDQVHVTGVELDPVTARIAGCCNRGPASSTPTSRAPTCRQASISPSAIHRSRIAPCARTAPTGPWGCASTTISSHGRSTF